MIHRRVPAILTMRTPSDGQLRSLFSRQRWLRVLRNLAPFLITLTFASIAHAQGTIDFSGAQTLMQTFKTFAAFLRRSDEGTLSRLLVEMAILLAASRKNAPTALRDAASAYKVDIEAITVKVKQEFAAKEKAKRAAQAGTKPAKKTAA